MSNIELIIAPRERDLGSFHVRRILPYATHRMVGPFIFFDHMGPTIFAPGTGMDVRPHPHIGLATVTYLFDGIIHHKDSLGSDQDIAPGDINWMTAGRGIVHSERSPDEFRKSGGNIDGVQLWVALPKEHEETEPTFFHHDKKNLPEFMIGNVKVKLLLGKAFNRESPVIIHSPLFYLDIQMPKGSTLNYPAHGEAAVYVVEGKINVDETEVQTYTMAVIKKCQQINIKADVDSRAVIIGGDPVGERFIFWNFVASSKQKLEEAKSVWKNGPGSTRFPKIPTDDKEYIPLPPEIGNPKGTPL